MADVERPVKERLLSAVADLQHYITHDVDIDLCAACPRWDELQDAAMSTVSEIEVLRAQLAETEEDLKAVADNYEMLKKTHGELEAEVGRLRAWIGDMGHRRWCKSGWPKGPCDCGYAELIGAALKGEG